jgi:cytochrome bd-type quinol oxidase subunit 2
MTKCLQAVVYAVSAAVSAFFFATWKRADDDLKSRVWRRYGWFCALAFVGSVGGLVTAAADSRFRDNYQRIAKFFEFGDQCRIIFGGSIDDIPSLLDCYHPQAVTFMNVDYWLAVRPVPYAIEFLCICCAKLLVRAHARPPSQSRRPHRDEIRWWSAWWSLLSGGSSFEAVGLTFYPALFLFVSTF